MSAPAGGIDFSDLFADAAFVYEPRPGAEEAVSQAIEKAGAGCVLITGEPGSGKTGLATHMISAGAWCCHFLRAGHTEFTLWRDPYAFLASVAYQLQALFGDAIFPESVAIDAKGRIHDVSKTGSVVGVDIERLVAVPWRRERIDVDLDVRKIAGDVTGVRIGELVENYRSVPLLAFREMALFEPLRRLQTLQRDAHVTLWVDGLDEDDGAGGIHSILPLGSECRQLGNITLIISSRRGRHLDRFVEDGVQKVELDGAALLPDTGRTVAAVIDRELTDARVTGALAALDWPVAELRIDLATASEGNFLFIRQYFEAVRTGFGAALRHGGLPKGLDDIHARILSTMVRDVADNQKPHVLSLLGALAVAQVPLSVEQLARFGALSAESVKGALQVLRPLLDETKGENPLRFACYHKSLRDGLVDPRHSDALWHIDAPAAHLRIATTYFPADGSAGVLDGYGVLYGATHLAQGGPAGAGILFDLLEDQWRRICRDLLGSNRVFHEALELARQCAWILPPADACARLIQLALISVYVKSAERQIPADALEIMVRLGSVQRALESVPEDLDAVEFARSNAKIIHGLLNTPFGDASLAARLLKRAFEKLKSRPDWLPRETAEVLDAWPLEKAEALREIFGEIESYALKLGDDRAVLLASFARIRTVLDPATANDYLRAAFDAVKSENPSESGKILQHLFTAWSALDPNAALQHLSARSFAADRHSAAGFMRLSLALAASGSPNSITGGAQLLLDLPEKPDGDRLEPAAMWIEIVRQIPQVWAAETAVEIVDRARRRLDEVRAARAAGSAPPAAEVALLVALAQAEPACKRGRDLASLGEAWQAVLDCGTVSDEDLERLVQLQSASDGELLEAYLNNAATSLRDRLWFAIVRAGLLPGHPGRAQALDRVVLAAEKPRATGWSNWYFVIAETAPLDWHDWSLELLRNAGVNAAIIVRWRVSVLRRLVAEMRPEATAWLRTTLEEWALSPNRNFIEELPAAVSGLPSELLKDAEIALPGIASRAQRRLLRAALARGIWTLDQPKAVALFDLACDEPPDGVDKAEVEEYVVRAFIAGQMHGVDPERATALWQDALDRLEARLPAHAMQGFGHHGRYLQLCYMLRALAFGAPDSAIALLAEMREPPPEKGERRMMTPFPSVSPFRVANLGESEYLLGRAMVRAVGTHRNLVLDTLANPLPPGGKAFALAQLAGAATTVALPQRLAWCNEAVVAAQEVENHALRTLLVAEGACATAAAGAKTRALETAAKAARLIEWRLVQADTVVSHVYASAFGRCVAVAIRCEAWETAWTWIWQARALGMHGFYAMLAEVPPAMQMVSSMSVDRYIEAEAPSTRLYAT